jgi:oligopeptide/dipeptide ABC transporter ATP-binding protein
MLATGPLLDVRNVSVEYRVGRRRPPIRAVDGVSFAIGAGETVGLAGESGSGKTTIGRAILGLAPIREGVITLGGSDITKVTHRERRRLSADLQVIFQDPVSSLNPARTVGQTLMETIRVHGIEGAEAATRVRQGLARVGLSPDAINRYPGHFSGGQRQRIAIARALIVRPKLVICDEPTSSLDLSIQAQILNLLRELQADFKVSYLFITHDLAILRHIAHRVIVLYRGQIMEMGDADRIYTDPVHPYSQALLAAAPVPDPDEQKRRRLAHSAHKEYVGASLLPRDGCPYRSRCPYSIDVCHTTKPTLDQIPGGGQVSCHRWREMNTLSATRAISHESG